MSKQEQFILFTEIINLNPFCQVHERKWLSNGKDTATKGRDMNGTKQVYLT